MDTLSPKPGVTPNDDAAQQISGFLQSVQEHMIGMLQNLVRMESPSSDAASLGQIMTHLQKELAAMGFESKILKPKQGQGAGHLYARPKHRERGRRAQLMLGHCDTVWPIGTLQTMPLVRDGAQLKGPGVFDMKAGIVQMYFALQAIEHCGFEMPLTPIIFINSDEEIGSPTATGFIRRLATWVQRVFVLEPALGASGKLKTARKGGASYSVAVKGKAAHAGLNPQDGISAILALSSLVQKLFALNDHAKGISVNVGMIEGGVQPNMIAPESRAIVEIRTNTIADWQRIEKTILELQPETEGISWEIRRRGFRPPMEATEGNMKLWALAKTYGAQLGLALENATAGGGSDGNTTSRFTPTLDGLGAVGDGAHAAHEFIDLDQWLARTALLAMLLLSPEN